MGQRTCPEKAPTDGAAALSGLTDAEVAVRVAAGEANVNTDVKTRSFGQIVAEHTLTLFNAVNIAMALLVFSTGQMRNLLFIWVVVANLAIGIFQEIRSKLIVDRLSILAARRVRVVRGGEERTVPLDEVVLDDLVCLSHGDQVPADAVIVRGEVMMDESLLTGESRPVEKRVGDSLMSGSFVDTGSLLARVSRVGAEGYAARISAEAKYVKRVNSEILSTLDMVIHFATYALVPLGLGLFLRTVGEGSGVDGAILSTVAAVAGMIPQGLVLLTSTVLAISTARLARENVLVQQLYCIETLARVDVLCLDKTGTITTGSMEVDRVVAVGDEDGGRDGEVIRAVSTISHAIRSDANETAKALLEYTDARGIAPEAAARVVPFSSARKYSGCVLADGRSLVMGAAKFVMGKRYGEVERQERSFGEQARVLFVATADGFAEDGSIDGGVAPLGFVSIRDQVRPTAEDTVRFFREQGVTLNVVSGDDPETVAAIARLVGVPGADASVDASTLDTPEKMADAVRHFHVFGRVTPQQKRELLQALKAEGHTVAMTGDGVNDVLALKEADCSVAMSSGSDAARNVAEVVLVDNDFAHMPQVVAEGRRAINNLQRSASLFLVKTVFSAALALVCIVAPPYPFLPVQMSLLSIAGIGVPSFVLALESNRDRVTGDFLANVLARSLPASVAIVACVLATICAYGPLGWTFAQASTVGMLLTAFIELALIVRISVPMTPLRRALVVVVVAIVLLGCTVLRGFFEVECLTFSMAAFSVVVGGLGLALFGTLFNSSLSHVSHEGRYVRFVRNVEEKHGRRSI